MSKASLVSLANFQYAGKTRTMTSATSDLPEDWPSLTPVWMAGPATPFQFIEKKFSRSIGSALQTVQRYLNHRRQSNTSRGVRVRQTRPQPYSRQVVGLCRNL